MKAGGWHDAGKIAVNEVADPVIDDPADAIVRTQQGAMPTVIEAYQAFDRREPGWTKVITQTGA